MRGGYALVSDTTGVLLDERAVHPGLTPPVLHTMADELGVPGLNLVVGSRTFDRPVRIDPVSHSARPFIDFTSPAARDPIAQLGAASAIGTLFVDRGSALVRTSPDAPFVERTDRYVFDNSDQITRPLSVAPDGSAVAFVFAKSAEPVGAVVLDASADWGAGEVAPVSIANDVVQDVWFDGPDRIVLTGVNTLRVLAAADAKHGVAKPLFADVTFEKSLLFAKPVPAGVLAIQEDGHAFLVQRDGTRIAFGHVPLADADVAWLSNDAVVTPHGRRIYWLEPAFQQRLHSMTLDPSTGQPLRDETPLTVPDGFAALLFLPDGEHAAAIDSSLDLLYFLD
jgi:hypothetical protein